MLRDISFEVADGEFCILLGPSGCGKSTILRLIAGLEQPSHGHILLGEKRLEALPPRARDVAFVFQNYALYPHMTVYENLAFSLRLKRVPPGEVENKVKDAASLLEIGELLRRKPQGLSGGQRQRVALGRAIVREPKIFLFDEPLSNLDASLRATMRVELARLHRRLRATILYVTHDQAEALTLGEKVIVLHQGEIQQIGPPSEIYHRPANPFVAGFVGSPQMNLIEGRLNSGGTLFATGTFQVDLSTVLQGRGSEYAGQPVTLGLRPEDLQPTTIDQAWFCGEVEMVEDLGSDQFVHLRCDSVEMVARIPGNVSVRAGERLGFEAEPSRVHLFYQGRRIAV